MVEKQSRIHGKNEKRISLRGLARLAGVDVSTVSRALNRDPSISEARAQAIRELAEKAGYRPQPIRTRRTRSIGVLLASDSRDHIGGAGAEFLQRIAWIAERKLSEHDQHVNIECVLRSETENLPEIVKQNRVDGVLVAGHPSAELVRRIRETGLPVVALNDTVTRLSVPCVLSDPSEAIREAVRTLASQGRRSFGFLFSELESATCQARLAAFREALSGLGLPVRDDRIVSGLPPAIAGGREGVRRLFREGPRPDALFCINDWVALGALHELQVRGLAVPDDIAVIGHDNVPFCETLEPPLTSIDRPESTLVGEAVRLLLEAVEGKASAQPVELRVLGRVVWRGSARQISESAHTIHPETAKQA